MRQKSGIIRGILEIAPIGIYIVNEKGKIDYVNSVMLAISGDNYKQFKSLNVFDLPLYKELGLDRRIRDVFKGEAFEMNSVEYVSYYSKKTTLRNFIGVPLEENDEKKALIFVEDITQIKKAEEAERKAIRMKEKLISIVSHELRSPLMAMRESVKLVHNETIGRLNNKQKEFLGITKRNIERLNRLASDVLDYQKLEAGRLKFNMKEASIGEVMKKVAKEMAPAAKAKGLKLTMYPAKDLPKANFDDDKITQVLTNLVNNAIKFTKSGSVKISSSRQGNAVCVSVSDTGVGIKKDDIDNLFQSFVQLSPQKDMAHGTGLGLIISKNIIERHGGRMDVRSRCGKGSVFSFLLPVKKGKKKQS